jgi:hypothetical protein
MIAYVLHFAHHNYYHTHKGIKHGTRWLQSKFYWPSMEKDIISFTKSCHICQISKEGLQSHVGLLEPLPTRKPRTHLQIDYGGPYFNLYYTLCAVCEETLWTLLSGTWGCGARETVETIINDWIPIMGWFRVLHSDLGSAFVSRLLKRLFKAFKIENIYASASDHRGIGKIERRIRILKDALQKWNLETNKRITEDDDIITRCEIIDLSLGFIMFGMNNGKCAFTQVSANELMFGESLSELPDIAYAFKELDDMKNDKKLNKTGLELVDQLYHNISSFRKIFHDDKSKYIKIMKKYYNKKRSNITYKKNDKVLYYCGKRKSNSYKLVNKWSGPWTVVEHLSPSIVRIYNDHSGQYRKCKTDFIKLYHQREVWTLQEY